MRKIIAWITPEGDRSITAAQKKDMTSIPGASARLAESFSVPCYSEDMPAIDWTAFDEIKEGMQNGLDKIQDSMTELLNKNADDKLIHENLQESFREVRRSKEFLAAFIAGMISAGFKQRNN